jgi:uncharacterized repeat protein (TIGR04138 family)
MDAREAMMTPSPGADILGRLARRNPRYAEAAYVFLLEALHHRLQQLERPRHLTGAELAEAVRDLALDRFGPLARTVLQHWGIHSTSDMGNVVFLLVESGILIKQPTDTPEDFEDLFSFEEAFETGYPWST